MGSKWLEVTCTTRRRNEENYCPQVINLYSVVHENHIKNSLQNNEWYHNHAKRRTLADDMGAKEQQKYPAAVAVETERESEERVRVLSPLPRHWWPGLHSICVNNRHFKISHISLVIELIDSKNCMGFLQLRNCSDVKCSLGWVVASLKKGKFVEMG